MHIQSFADPRYTQPIPEGVPTHLYKDKEDEPNPIEEINKNVEQMDENEMEKMMEEEEYANKQLQRVAVQIEKEKKRKEREAKKQQVILQQQQQQHTQIPPLSVVAAPTPPQPLPVHTPKKRGRKPKNQFQMFNPVQEPIVSNVDGSMVNNDNNDELSEPPGVSLPMFGDLGGSEGAEDAGKKRRGEFFDFR